MRTIETRIPGVLRVVSDRFPDNRGWFQEFPGAFKGVVQTNVSYSHKGVLRGLHYQRGSAAQGKLVWAAVGRVLDAAVDLRPHSETYLQHLLVELSGNEQLYIPPGCAHGFLALEDTLFVYGCTAPYAPGSEAGVRWDDPTLAIPWGIQHPILSEKDSQLPLLK